MGSNSNKNQISGLQGSPPPYFPRKTFERRANLPQTQSMNRRGFEMPRGGRRPGAGRKKGSATVRTRAIADAAMANPETKTPLEHMLATLNSPYTSQARKDRAAECLLPFLHPRLSATAMINAGGQGGQPGSACRRRSASSRFRAGVGLIRRPARYSSRLASSRSHSSHSRQRTIGPKPHSPISTPSQSSSLSRSPRSTPRTSVDLATTTTTADRRAPPKNLSPPLCDTCHFVKNTLTLKSLRLCLCECYARNRSQKWPSTGMRG